LAYTPGVIYLILSLLKPGKPDLRGFVLNGGNPDEISIVVGQ